MKSKTIKNLNRVIVITFLIILMSSFLYYFKVNLFFTDKYLWYHEISVKNYHAYKKEKALEHSEKAISLDPNRIDARRLRARIYYQYGQYNLAAKEMEYFRDDPIYDFQLALILYKQGKFNESVELFKIFNKKHKCSAYGFSSMSKAYFKLGDMENAKKAVDLSWDRINLTCPPEMHSNSENIKYIHAITGFIYKEQNLPEKAEKEFQIVRSIDKSVIDSIRTDLYGVVSNSSTI